MPSPAVTYHLVIGGPNRFVAATPAIANRQVVTPRKIFDRLIKRATFLQKSNKAFVGNEAYSLAGFRLVLGKPLSTEELDIGDIQNTRYTRSMRE
jgi:hypothetical protein